MRVGEEDAFHAQAFGGDQTEQVLDVGAGVDDGGLAGLGVPDEVVVDRHVPVGGVEHGEAAREDRGARVGLFFGEDLEGVGGELEMAGEAAEDAETRLAGLDGGEVGGGDLGAGDEFGVGDAEAALGLGDDVVEVVLEGNERHGKRCAGGAKMMRARLRAVQRRRCGRIRKRRG